MYESLSSPESPLKQLRSWVSHISKKKKIQMLTLVAIIAALPTVTFLAQQQQNYLQHASDYTTSNTIVPFSFDLQDKINFIGFPATPMDEQSNNLTAKKFLEDYTHSQCDSVSSPDYSRGTATAYSSDPAKIAQNTLTYLSGAKAYFVHCNLPSSPLRISLTGERIDGTTLVKELGQQPLTLISLPHNFQCLEKQACTPHAFLETVQRLSTDKTFSAFPLTCNQLQGFNYAAQQLVTYTESSVANQQFAATPMQEEKGYVIACSHI